MVLFGSGVFGLLGASARRFFRQTKRGIDLFVASIAIIIFAIPGVLIAILIKLTSPGPVFLQQERVGENKRRNERRGARKAIGRRSNANYGKHFIMYKFRTMRADAEKVSGPVWCAENDPRITFIGRFLRKTHLDELPQLINVFKGEMSIIGPRPERPVFVKALHAEIHRYPNRLKVKPGITGLAQVRQHYDSSLRDVKRKVHYDLLYIRRMCLLMDVRIVFSTFWVMMTGKGAR
jgi:lipopolysaccharide/colanic/teichoic acid biosynthesis glycosyltransferase